MKTRIGAIVAVDDDDGIGKNGKMAWYIPEDFKHFKEYTKNSLCIMGSVTFHDISSHKKTDTGEFLPGRNCIVLTTRPDDLREHCNYTGVHFMSDGHMLEDLICLTSMSPNTTALSKYDKFCIIGGRSIYDLFSDILDEIVVTRVKGTHDCDTHIDLTSYTEAASTVTGWKLGNTPHVVEVYIIGGNNED